MTSSASAPASASLTSIQDVILALKAISDTQARHTILLKQIVDAATKPVGEESAVTVALRALAAATTNQTQTMQALQVTMAGLPDRITAGMKKEMDQALRELD